MITHPDIEAYILGQHDESGAIEAHIAGCDECLAEVGREARLELLLHTAGHEDAFAAVVAAPRARRWPLVAAAGLAMATAASAYVLWPREPELHEFVAPPPTAVLTGQQPASRPIWAADIRAESSRCTDSDGDLTCAAAALGATQDEAEVAAEDIAREMLLERLIMRSQMSIAGQLTVYGAARSAAMASPDLAGNRRIRHAVASRAALGHRDSWYWEEYDALDGDGTEFLVFVRLVASKAEIDELLARYQVRTTGGAELVPVVPAVRWALDPGDDMAWFVHRSGTLAKLGVRDGDVLLHDPRRRLVDLPRMIARKQLRIWRDGTFR